MFIIYCVNFKKILIQHVFRKSNKKNQIITDSKHLINKENMKYRIEELAYIHMYDTFKIQYIDVCKTKSFPCFA